MNSFIPLKKKEEKKRSMLSVVIWLLMHGIVACWSESFKAIPPTAALKASFSEGRKEIFYLWKHSTHFIYGYMA